MRFPKAPKRPKGNACFFQSAHIAQPVPVREGEDAQQDEGGDRHGDACLEEILGGDVACAVGDHILRGVHRENIAEADGVLEDHGHAEDMNARAFHALQDGDNDGDHGRGKPGGVGEAQMDHREEYRHDHEDHHRRHGLHAGCGHKVMSEPHRSLALEKRAPEADAHAEEGDGAPVDMRHGLLPGHDAPPGQHEEHDARDRDRGGVEGMQFFLRHPEEEEQRRYEEEFLFRQAHRPHFIPHALDGFFPAGHFLHFGRHGLDEDEVEHHREDHRIGRGGDKPFQPADVLAEDLLDESHGDHILRGGGLDADIPQTVRLRHGHHEHAREGAARFEAERADDARHDGHHAGYARRGGRHEEGEQKAHEDDADDEAVRLDADAGHDEKGDALVQPGDHHGGGEEHGPRHESPGGRGESRERQGERLARAEQLLRMRRIGRHAEQKGHERDDDKCAHRIGHAFGHPDDDREGEDADEAVPLRGQVGRRGQTAHRRQGEYGEKEAVPFAPAFFFHKNPPFRNKNAPAPFQAPGHLCSVNIFFSIKNFRKMSSRKIFSFRKKDLRARKKDRPPPVLFSVSWMCPQPSYVCIVPPPGTSVSHFRSAAK